MFLISSIPWTFLEYLKANSSYDRIWILSVWIKICTLIDKKVYKILSQFSYHTNKITNSLSNYLNKSSYSKDLHISFDTDFFKFINILLPFFFKNCKSQFPVVLLIFIWIIISSWSHLAWHSHTSWKLWQKLDYIHVDYFSKNTSFTCNVLYF